MPPSNNHNPPSSDRSFMDAIDAELAEAEQKRLVARDKLNNVLLTDSQKKVKQQKQEYANEVEEIAKRREKNGLSVPSLNVNTFDPGMEENFDPVNFTETLNRKVQQKKSTQAKSTLQTIPFKGLTAKLNQNIAGKIKKPSLQNIREKESKQSFAHNINQTKSTLPKPKPKTSSQGVPFMDLTAKTSQKIPGKITRPSFLGKDENKNEKNTTPFVKSAAPITKPQMPKNMYSQPVPIPKTIPIPVAKPKTIPIPVVKTNSTPIPVTQPKTAPIPVVKTNSTPIPVTKPKTAPIPVVKDYTSLSSVPTNAAPFRKSPQCVICYSPITLDDSDTNNVLIECLNDHPVHRNCLKMWIVHSDLCPVCSMPYSHEVLESFKSFKDEQADQKVADAEREKQEKIKQEQEELLKKINPEFTQKYNEADKLMKSKQYETALDKFWDIIDQKYFPPKDQRILRTTLNIGLIYHRQGKHSQCIKQLMKIVKIDFNFPLAFYFLGLSYDQLGMQDKMKWALERALKNTEHLAQSNPKYQKFCDDIERRLKIQKM
ncbi:MAG: hypothetical protein ACTSVZ_05610 [Promethearchaeota archaeon]